MTCPRTAYGVECPLPAKHTEPHATGDEAADAALNAPAHVLVLVPPTERRTDASVLRRAISAAAENGLQLISAEPSRNANPPAAKVAWRLGYRLVEFPAKPIAKEES